MFKRLAEICKLDFRNFYGLVNYFTALDNRWRHSSAAIIPIRYRQMLIMMKFLNSDDRLEKSLLQRNARTFFNSSNISFPCFFPLFYTLKLNRSL